MECIGIRSSGGDKFSKGACEGALGGMAGMPVGMAEVLFITARVPVDIAEALFITARAPLGVAGALLAPGAVVGVPGQRQEGEGDGEMEL